VPEVGLLLDKWPFSELLPVVEPTPVPATDPQGCPLRPVDPDIDGVFVPAGLLPVVDEEPDVPDGPDPVPLPELAPALPPDPPPPPPPP
jgi:hypothetical protein